MNLLKTAKVLVVGLTLITGMTVASSGRVAADTTNTDDQQTVASDQVPCVDGTDRANLVLDWHGSTGLVNVHTVNNAPLCSDVTVYFTDYTLPATYDESGVFDDSSLPQTYFNGTTAVLAQGTNGDTTLNVKRPDACTPYQIDLYYPPEITTVPAAGHTTQLIWGQIYNATSTDCTTADPGTVLGDSTTTPPATAVLAASTTAAPAAALTDTGKPVLVPAIIAFLTATTAIAVSRFGSKKTNI